MAKTTLPWGIEDVVRPRGVTYNATPHQWGVVGEWASRTFPTICVHRWSVSLVSRQASTANAGQIVAPLNVSLMGAKIGSISPDGGTEETTVPVTLRVMTPDDWPRVAEILGAGLEEGEATFETRVPEWEDWDRSHLPGLRLVAVDAEGQVVGWVAASPVSRRPVYEGVVEHSIYVDPRTRGGGVGRTLLERFITDSENAGVWTLQSGIFPENTASLALHLGCGFRVVGTRESLARHHGIWRDVVLVERRSPRVR